MSRTPRNGRRSVVPPEGRIDKDEASTATRVTLTDVARRLRKARRSIRLLQMAAQSDEINCTELGEAMDELLAETWCDLQAAEEAITGGAR